MLIHYVSAMQEGLWTLWGWASSSMGIAVLTLAGASLFLWAAMALKENEQWGRIELWQRGARWSAGWVGVFIVATLGWFGMGAVYRVTQIDERWREGAVAVTDPLPSGAPIVQSGPALASIGERTYTRVLRLPPVFLKDLGEEGLGVLAPYVEDPTERNVLRLRDQFRRSGKMSSSRARRRCARSCRSRFRKRARMSRLCRWAGEFTIRRLRRNTCGATPIKRRARCVLPSRCPPLARSAICA